MNATQNKMTYRKAELDGYLCETERGTVWVYRRENERNETKWFARFAKASDDYGWGDTRDEAVRELLA